MIQIQRPHERVRAIALVLLFALGTAGPSWAQGEVAPAHADRAASPAAAPDAKPPADAVSSHRLALDGATFDYTATVGLLPLADSSGVVKAQIGYTSYLRADAPTQRPIAFIFNGGPGAASAYLQFGALGPKRVVLNEDGTAPPPPAQLAANPTTWLAFTDLVFVDPIGTGFSRPTRVDGKPVPTSEFWSVEHDIEWNARFIRDYLTRAQRWTSPKFLIGESYGGFRVARLAEFLPSQFGIGINGVVMISPVLEFMTIDGDERYGLWPAVLRLPSYAAAAWAHGRAAEASQDPAARDRFLAEVESFALKEYLPSLALGHALPLEQRQALYARVAAFTGMPLTTVVRGEGRISRETFIKEVLGPEGRVVGRYDASVSLPDPNPASPRFTDTDPTLGGLSAPLTTAVNAYLRGELGYAADRPYVLLNPHVSGAWDWGGRRGSGAGAAENLRAAMVASPSLKVLIAHGRLDLVTPYFTSAYVARQMRLAPPLRGNLSLTLYDGGHMMYLHRGVREQLYRDVRALFAAATAAGG